MKITPIGGNIGVPIDNISIEEPGIRIFSSKDMDEFDGRPVGLTALQKLE